MNLQERNYLIKDIDCTITVEVSTRKELLSYLDEYVENMQYDWFDASDQAFHILYKDGRYICINEEYNGQKIKITNIAAIVYDNPCTSMVYGNYEINEHGVVSPAFETEINEGVTRIA